MMPSLPILVFGTLFLLWSRISLAPVEQAVPEDNKTEDNNTDNKIIVQIVQAGESA